MLAQYPRHVTLQEVSASTHQLGCCHSCPPQEDQPLEGISRPRRARIIKGIAKEKTTKSASKLSYMDALIPPTPGPALRGTGKPGLVTPQAESLSPSSSSSEENEVLIVIDARLLILISSRQGPAPRPAPCDGPRPRLKRKAVFLEVADVVTSSGKGQSASQPEPRVKAARSSRPTPSSSKVPRPAVINSRTRSRGT